MYGIGNYYHILFILFLAQRDGSTALIQACLCNHPQIVRVLLECNPNVNLADKVRLGY